MKTFSGLQLEPDIKGFPSANLILPNYVCPAPFLKIDACTLSTVIITNCTDTAGSALDYLEEFDNSFISISDNQSSYPAHLFTMQAFHSIGMFFFFKSSLRFAWIVPSCHSWRSNMKNLRLNPPPPPPRAFVFPFCHDGELNSSLIVLPSISVLLQEFNASLASSAVAKSTNAYLRGEEDSSQPGSNKGYL